MGLDGGTIPTRCELVKTKKKEVKVFDKDQVDYGKWFLCSLAQNTLSEPIVIDDLGNLFNKDNILEALLNGTLETSKNFSHIRSLRSIYTVNFSSNPAHEKDSSVSPWLCPITKLEVGSSSYKFKILKTCGHVFSEKSFKELLNDDNNNNTTTTKKEIDKSKNDQLSCFLCSKEYTTNDLITINPLNEELEQMKIVLQEKLANSKKKSNKKSDKKSDKKRSLESNLTSESSFTSNTLEKTNEEITKKMKSETFSSIFKSNNDDRNKAST
ncbi:hypothetical protein RB653_008537 [Dictyostelium firmibasis]|uniref:Replication termination factor 2 n=1 Tax=Dictyostelium firmibasis TaxID=79012 RepID=A0AAN7TZ84_9MYCE